MSFLVIISWILVAMLTAVNVFIFLKLKNASEMMMKSMFPGARDMNEAMHKMSDMMKLFPNMGPMGGVGPQDQRLKMAMDMLQKMQAPKK